MKFITPPTPLILRGELRFPIGRDRGSCRPNWLVEAICPVGATPQIGPSAQIEGVIYHAQCRGSIY
ncbi:MAG: hypothetical protein COY82_01965 [Parcubacteria group bacterium CG_4_10_14_0_8_um_filter_35_7]|nr:MAG: hypothetical protein COX43_02100 [Parcubacteria group bacterium CG23_combo_of_CG06-09_8_20_14_all_35_9]PIY78535.1 MAG: hypothetical protein COY82_01965 [Parcubacteria group bacterium CG_4_10_14_0_8_um_filter_35_7]